MEWSKENLYFERNRQIFRVALMKCFQYNLRYESTNLFLFEFVVQLISWSSSIRYGFLFNFGTLFITIHTHHLAFMWCNKSKNRYTLWTKYKLVDDIELVLELTKFFCLHCNNFPNLQKFNAIFFSLFYCYHFVLALFEFDFLFCVLLGVTSDILYVP